MRASPPIMMAINIRARIIFAAPRRLYRSEGLHAALLLGCRVERLRSRCVGPGSTRVCGSPPPFLPGYLPEFSFPIPPIERRRLIAVDLTRRSKADFLRFARFHEVRHLTVWIRADAQSFRRIVSKEKHTEHTPRIIHDQFDVFFYGRRPPGRALCQSAYVIERG